MTTLKIPGTNIGWTDLAKLTIRLLVTTAIFIFILHSLDLAHVVQALRQSNINLLLLALLMQFGSTAISAYRWQLIMQNINFHRSFSFYWRSYFKAMFFNQGLPANIGGDVLRVIDLVDCGFKKLDSICGVSLDRIVGLMALMLLNLIFCAFAPNLLPAYLYYLLLFLMLGGLVCFFILFYIGRCAGLEAYPVPLVIKNLTKIFYLAFAQRQIYLLISSMLIPLLAILGFFMAGSALGLNYGLVIYLIIVPPAILLTAIPISLAGWGVREGGLITLFALVGADKSTVLAMSILYGIMLIIVSLPGLFVYLAGQQRLRTCGESC